MEGFKALGLSYHNTPIAIRERLAFTTDEASEFLLKLKETVSIDEALFISTCNRTEVYISSTGSVKKEVIAMMASFKGLAAVDLAKYLTEYDAEAASQHLFRVALGLESQVLGDIQISNQVKRAYQQSADLGLAGPHLHRLMHTIFYANKRVVQETSLQDGMASVASVAVDLIAGFIGKVAEPRIALIGLGEIGQNVLDNLEGHDLAITLVNRTKSKAEKIAKERHTSVRDFADLGAIIEEHDVIISAVTTQDPIISATDFSSQAVHKLVIDLSVPRGIASDVEGVPGVALYNVDQLTERTLKAREIRSKAVPAVESIITEELKGFENWKSEMEVSPTIKKLKKALDEIRKEELARHKKLSDQEMELLDVVTKNMIQKVIKLPVLQLKAACKRGEAETLVGVLSDLFNLEAAAEEKK